MVGQSARRAFKAALVAGVSLAALWGEASAQPRAAQDDRRVLQERIDQLEKRLADMEAKMAASAALAATPATEAPGEGTSLEERVTALETNTVTSAPKTLVKQVQVYVDANGLEYDEPGPGRTVRTTYQRERVFRRQTIDEAIEEALSSEKGVSIGVSSVTSVQGAFQSKGPANAADGHVYGLSAADITFAANSAALNTTFFADVVGIGGSPPDGEIQALNLINSQAARLSNNQLNLREAWIRTGLFKERLHVSVGRLDLTNYFDKNAVANDENSMFISDPLVNNPTLGLSNNGLGAAAVWDPRGSYNVKVGVQQSTPAATSLSESVFSLAEFEYIARPFGLGEGHYRIWGRSDNSTGDSKTAYGVSFDQKLRPAVTLFGRYGSGYVDGFGGNTRFYSGGLSFGAPYAFNPDDAWGVGYAQTELTSGPNQGAIERMGEVYYNLYLTQALRLSGMVQYVFETQTGEAYILPGARLAVGF
ncbi:MAG TPA: carbohydrate porin [Caulobacterales bacterium]|nr:carbohydrate porin [Caulobacterales bacterium]